jgi:hypothetical protein
MQPEQRRRATVVDVDRRTWARIDLEQQGTVSTEDEVDAA